MRKTRAKVHIGLQVWYPRDVKTAADRLAFLRVQSLEMPVRVMMPCGKFYMFFHAEDIPIEDQGCECRNPHHWLVLWRSS